MPHLDDPTPPAEPHTGPESNRMETDPLEILGREAQRLLLAGDLERARTLIDRAARLAPRHPGVLRVSTAILLAADEPAVDEAVRAVEAAPDDSMTHTLHARALYAEAGRGPVGEVRARWDEAEQAARRALALAPDDVEVWLEHAALAVQSEPEEALERLRHAQALRPGLVPPEALIEVFGDGALRQDELLDTFRRRTGREPDETALRAAREHRIAVLLGVPVAALAWSGLIAGLLLNRWGAGWPHLVTALLAAAVLAVTAVSAVAAVPGLSESTAAQLRQALHRLAVALAALCWLAGLVLVVAAAVGAPADAGARVSLAVLTGGAGYLLLRWRAHRDLRTLQVVTGHFVPAGVLTLVATVGALMAALLAAMAATPAGGGPQGADRGDLALAAAVVGAVAVTAAVLRLRRGRRHARSRSGPPARDSVP